jgi:hypothetical protein
MDCKTARLLLDYARPTPAELPGGDVAALESHLTACPECEALARAERQADDRLGRAVRDVPVPDGLRDRLLAHLRAERRRWYRRWAVRGAGALAAAAACLALAAGLWQYCHRPRRQAPDVETIAYDVSVQNAQRTSAQRVDEWFDQKYHGNLVVAPQDFDGRHLNYGSLAYCDLAPCQGERVPMLLFVSGSDQARVYILSGEQFNLDGLPDQSSDSGGYKTAVRSNPEDGRVKYLFIYTGNSMDPFLMGGVLNAN